MGTVYRVSVYHREMKSKHGTVSLECYRNRFRLHLPRELFQGKNKYVYTRFEGSEEGRKEAQKLAWQIEEDIASGVFDFTLEKYKPTMRIANRNLTYSLLDVWESYCEYRKDQVAETTFEMNYRGRYLNAIKELPTDNLRSAVEIRDYLLKTRSIQTTKQLLIQFNAACKYAVKSKLTDVNPFEGMASDLRVKREQYYHDINPFTPEEVKQILMAFEGNRYYGFVKFLFLTGCRTSEAVGLKWRDINDDCTQIVFSGALVKGIEKGTKNGRTRKFPCNKELRELLLNMRKECVSFRPDAFVFTNSAGNHINPASFIHCVWGGDKGDAKNNKTEKIGIVKKLALEGKISAYRPQYNTRHTFITMCLEQGVTIPQIARWVGNSPETLLKHYGGVIQQMQPPSLFA